MKKRTLALILAALMAISVSACGTQSAEPEEAAETEVTAAETETGNDAEEGPISNMGNPVHEMTQEELAATAGIDLPAPEGAENPVWAAIYSDESDMLAQLTYEKDGEQFCLRAKPTGVTALAPAALPETEDDVNGYDPDAGNLSGIYSRWTSCVETDVQGRTAFCYLSEDDGNGYIAWIDVVPGILYNLSMLEGTDADTLTGAANEAFVPLQGDS